MKKLMTVIAAVTAAFGLFAETAELVESKIDFSEATPGAFEFGEDDSGDLLWWKTGDAEGTITEGDLGNFLALEADAPVYRTAATVDPTLAQVAIADADAERGGIIFDQKVKFSAFDIDTVVPEGLDTEGAKIAVWVKTITEEDGETPAVNHLMVTAGKLDSMLLPDVEKSVVTVDAGVIDVDEFHQLKITAIEAGYVDGVVVPGFTVTIDNSETPITWGTEEDLFPVDPSLSGGTYSAEGAALIKSEQLFPSLVAYNGEATLNPNTLQGVAFKGTGSIQSIDIRQHDLYNIEVAIVPPTGAKFGTLVNAEPVVGKDNTYSVTPGATVSGTLVADGAYVVKKADFSFENVSKETEFKFADDAVVEAVAQIGDVYYAPLADAFAAAQDNDTITMLDDVALDAYIEVSKDVTFDLGGKTLSAASSGAFDVYSSLTVENGDITTGKWGIWANPNASVTLADGATLICVGGPDNAAGIIADANTTVIVNGEVTLSKTDAAAISGIGNESNAGAQITIGATATIVSSGTGIYFPTKDGVLTIADGASITADDNALEVKAGTVTIGKATIKSTKAIAAATSVKNTNGTSAKGYALAIVENKAYADNISVSIAAEAKIAGKVGIVLDDLDAPAPKAVTIANGALFTDKDGAATLIAEDQQMAAEADEDGFYAVEAKEPPAPTFTVTFSTNTVTVAEKTLTDVESGKVLTEDDVPDFGEGTWDVQPLGAIITCDTNFNFTVKAEENWDVPEDKKDAPASDVWTKVPQNLANVPAGRLSTWAKANNVPFGGEFNETMEEAYLLNCAPDKVAETKTQINIASIEFKDGEWVIKTVSGNIETEEFGNGKLELVDVTKDVTGAEGSDAAKLWKMKLVPITAK